MDRHSCRKESVVRAAIDIGTNTVLLLVGEVRRGRLHIIDEAHRAPRLGRGVDEAQNLSPEAMDRVIEVLTDYKLYIQQNHPAVDHIHLTATSAVRDAQNRSYFLRKIKEQTGLEVEVLNGLEEARFTFVGALSVLETDSYSQKKAIIDIGGGSTEIAIGRGEEVLDSYSFDMGCVRFTERYLKNDPLSVKQVEQCRTAIDAMLDTCEFDIEEDTELIGVAGTVTSLAFIDREMKEYNPSLLNGYMISVDKLKEYIGFFSTMKSEELKARYPKVMKERADIFRAGLLILERFMERYKFQKLKVSTGGIRHGTICLYSDR